MSPEQARGLRDIDYRSDIWSFSVVLYEAISGVRPFEGDNYNAVIVAVAEDKPVPSTLHVAGDQSLWAILERGLKKNRSERWQSMREMGVALAEWLADQGVGEDICGTSLFAKWLHPGGENREHSASSPGRRSQVPTPNRRSLIPTERIPESGSRSIVTIETPPALSSTFPPAKKTIGWKLPVGAGLAVLAAVLTWVVFARRSQSAEHNAPEKSSEPVHAAVEAPRVEPPAAAPAGTTSSAQPAEQARNVEPKPSTSPRAPRERQRSERRPAKAAAPATATEKPPVNLKDPYE